MKGGMNYFVEFRSLNIKPDKREEFHRLYLQESLPLLKRWNIDVVAYNPSLHDENTYYVFVALIVSPSASKVKMPFMVVTTG